MRKKGSNKGESVTYMYMKINGHVHMYMYDALSPHKHVNMKGF